MLTEYQRSLQPLLAQHAFHQHCEHLPTIRSPCSRLAVLAAMFPEELAEEEVPHTDAARAFLVRSGGAALRFSLPQRYPLQLPLLSLSCPSAGHGLAETSPRPRPDLDYIIAKTMSIAPLVQTSLRAAYSRMHFGRSRAGCGGFAHARGGCQRSGGQEA